MIRSWFRGHEIHYIGKQWVFADTKEPIPIDEGVNIPCALCGRYPTKEGYDACIGKVEGASSVCCGHGVHEPFIK